VNPNLMGTWATTQSSDLFSSTNIEYDASLIGTWAATQGSDHPIPGQAKTRIPTSSAYLQALLGQVTGLYKSEQWGQALALCRTGIDLCRQVGDQDSLAALLMFEGAVWNRQGQNDAALRDWGEAETIFRSTGNQHELATSLVNQVQILRERGELDTALLKLDEAESNYSGSEAANYLEQVQLAKSAIIQQIVLEHIAQTAAVRNQKRWWQFWRKAEHIEQIQLAKSGVMLRIAFKPVAQTATDRNQKRWWQFWRK